jgi:hypothetical protein
VNSSQLADRGWCCPSARLLTLREDYLSACDGSLPEALLLQAIAWKTYADDPDAWLRHSEAQWASEMFDSFDAKTQRSARRRLLARGLIEADTKQSHGMRSTRTVRLRINGSHLQQAIRAFEEARVTRGKFPQSYIGNKNSCENSSQKKLATLTKQTLRVQIHSL